MTYEMEYLMHIYSCGAMGADASPPEKPLDWEKLVRAAVEQSITYTAAMAIKKSDTGCPNAIKARLISSLIGASIVNQSKTAAVIKLLEDFERLGIHAVLLKGIDAARYYANPECRVSADTDILISCEDESSALEFLRNQGCKIIPRVRESHHSVCIHPIIGMTELHVLLWEDMLDDVLFKSSGASDTSCEPHRNIITDDGNYYALGYNDTLMFLTLHMIKHFITGGMSLRMMMDTSLYFRHEINNIDTARYWSILRALRYDRLMNIVFGAMIKYCGFSSNDFPGMGKCSDEDILAILNDLERGGWQGKNDGDNRRDGWFYLKRERQIKENGRLKFALAVRLDILRDKLFALFPPIGHLSVSYPKLLHHRWMYPLCWLHRLFLRGIKASASGKTKSRKNINGEEKLTDSGRERLELFKKLEMI